MAEIKFEVVEKVGVIGEKTEGWKNYLVKQILKVCILVKKYKHR